MKPSARPENNTTILRWKWRLSPDKTPIAWRKPLVSSEHSPLGVPSSLFPYSVAIAAGLPLLKVAIDTRLIP